MSKMNQNIIVLILKTINFRYIFFLNKPIIYNQ